ncbi:MAG: metal ABC transporter ATP-binding protein [Actinobacteria bacterium]|nr:metal ABC transporter ATP-binding protein [Actinomycetota bacterium]MBU1943267.1 metal ABC transporter ATP-binding protein [Actinomycetota bacterium]MBU2688984.1 metal ABC transporter ATP-binding protein [Actinomycetota bacterium]
MSRQCRVAEYFDGSAGERGPLIELDHVNVSMSGYPVLDDITFTLGERTFLGVVGPNGAGKTTLLRVMLGLIAPDNGTVRVMGMGPRELKHELHHIGYMPQTVLFDPTFPVSVFDVVMMGRSCCIGVLRFPGRADRAAVQDGIELVGLKGLEKRPIGELSGGQQKRAFLARALCRETRILFLDEPTSGLDLPAQEQFMDLLTRLKEEMGLSVIFVSHDVQTLARYSDDMICINHTMHLHGRPSDVVGSDRLKEAYRCEFDFLVGGGEHTGGR